MNREQLRNHMRAKPYKGGHLIHYFDSEIIEWQHAFKLAKLSGMESMDMECTTCIRKVREWLEA